MIVEGDDGLARCGWGDQPPIYRAYHDQEWGRATTEDRALFEKVCLEGFQAGLSWLTILRKRESFRAAFAGFDYSKVAAFDEADVARLLGDPGIVRHEGKIRSTINNARRALEMVGREGSLSGFFWARAPAAPGPPDPAAGFTEESTALASELRSRGWTYVGPTTAYAFMQAMGLVNDHLAGCHARSGCEAARQEVLDSL